MPSADDPARICPDIMHTYNLGFGKDMVASGIFLLCRHNIFPGASIGAKLDAAFESFKSWCEANRKTPSLKGFELKTFKITSQLI